MAAGCGVEIFLVPNSYIDVASVAEVSRLTGGNVHKYSYFHIERDGQQLIEDVRNSISKQVAFDAVIRVRTSMGVYVYVYNFLYGRLIALVCRTITGECNVSI